MRLLSLCLVLCPVALNAHELWLEPLDFTVETNGSLVANIVNGQHFDGPRLSYIPRRFQQFLIVNGADINEIEGRIGDTPAAQVLSAADGLNVLVYESLVQTVTYETFDRFATFVAHKDLGVTLEDHLALGYPEADFTEAYRRFSKSLVAVGDGAGADRRVGLETELVALTNPYTDDVTQGFQVQLFYQDAARPDVQVEVFERAADGGVAVTTVRTNAQGIATVPVLPGHDYMLDAVYLRAPEGTAVETSAVWETLWANLTFAVPQG
jgi:uncharacterized GH25 family protein